MALVYFAKDDAATVKVGHSFLSQFGTDTYEYNRFYLKFDVTGPGIFRGDAGDGLCRRTETTPTGTPPTPVIP